jgi:hypothetical protein
MIKKTISIIRKISLNIWHRTGFRIVSYTPGEKIVNIPINHQIVPNFRVKANWDYRTVQPFGEIASQIIGEGRTLLSYDRLFVIYQSLKNVRNLNGIFAEVGTYRGGTSAFICHAANSLDIPSWKHYVIDTFKGHDERDINTDQDHIAHHQGLFSDTIADDVRKYLVPLGNISICKGRIQDVCSYFNEELFSFIHLDVDLYEPTIFALEFFGKRMLPGGVIVIDDFSSAKCPGIEKAVQEITSNYLFDEWYLGTEQFVLVKNNIMNNFL